MKDKRSIGARYERVAGEYLERHGYEIVTYNFRSRNGEIDIIASHGEYLVFVEVKYRAELSYGSPLEAIDDHKKQAICRSAFYYIQKNGLVDTPVRFDVIGILGQEITLIQNAFDFELQSGE